MNPIVALKDARQVTLADVGGKALGLVRLIEAGVMVPPGVVLTSHFFLPWFQQIKQTPAWAALPHLDCGAWKRVCRELTAHAQTLRLNEAQRRALARALEQLRRSSSQRYAVRSSSPDEDLEAASFAGGYESRLGVSDDRLADAVRECFASSLDHRVFAYKREHGYNVLAPSIAVIVQEQLDSDVAGVGFSINPLTNDYDEAVIDANWGLGESVVAGRVTPDHFLVDKVSRHVLQRKLGSKQLSIRLAADGGTVQRADARSAELTLNDTQIAELTIMICRIEKLFEKPVDIEWAFARGQLNVLQARPITAYVPLPAEMVTYPGQRRMLYGDIALSKGMAINAPISPMGLDWLAIGVSALFHRCFGSARFDLSFEQSFWFYAGGRMYQNLSNIFWLAGPEKIAKASAPNDLLMSETLAHVDASRYRTTSRPPWARLRMIQYVPRVIWQLRRFFWNLSRAMLCPERAFQSYQREVEALQRRLSENIDYSVPVDAFHQRYYQPMVRSVFDVTMAVLMGSLIALGLIDRVVGKQAVRQGLADKLKLGFTGNLVAEMGIAMFRLANQLEPADYEDLAELEQRICDRQLSHEFLKAWDSFLANFGCRGPGEMDLARPRYADDPSIVLRQMSFMTIGDRQLDPEVAQARNVNERREAYERLMRRCGWLRRSLLRRLHHIIERFAGTRDTPKHQNLLLHRIVRRRVMIEGRHLADQGRLDRAEDVFNLTFNDLRLAASDPSLDLRQISDQRTRFLKRLETVVTNFPGVIDSRGRILRPPARKEIAGELRGMAVSPGIVRGPVKLLRDPSEKPVCRGDVLVAYTADPGWTPLFASAAAVVLEVGGLLQHGAVVAREYGKPCVVGIDRLTQRLRDGQMVEVDGTTGVVRLLDPIE